MAESFTDIIYGRWEGLDVFFAFDKEGEECLEFQAVDALVNYQPVWDAFK